MKAVMKAVVRVQELMVIVLHDSIVKAAKIKDCELFTQEVTEEGILLKRVEKEAKP